jgi:hypothetical protein
LKLTGEIGRVDGAGARRPRREHHRALKTLGCDVHAAVTALLKAGVKRRTEAEKHDNAPQMSGPDRIRMTEFSALAVS